MRHTHIRFASLTILVLSTACALSCLGCSPLQGEAREPQNQSAAPSSQATSDNPARDANSPQGDPADNALTPEQQTDMEKKVVQERDKLADYETQLAPYKQVVPLGETFSLANLEDAPITITTPTGENVRINVPKFVPWVGTLDATVLDATPYGSLEEAQAAAELGAVLQPTPPEGIADPKLLVMRLEVTNVDATPGYTAETPGEYFALDAFKPYYPCIGEAAGSFMDYVGGTLATFDGAPEGLDPQSPYVNDFALPVGETRTLTAGWWVDGTVDPSLIIMRPSLSGSNPGPVTFDLGLGRGDEPDEPAA